MDYKIFCSYKKVKVTCIHMLKSNVANGAFDIKILTNNTE